MYNMAPGSADAYAHYQRGFSNGITETDARNILAMTQKAVDELYYCAEEQDEGLIEEAREALEDAVAAVKRLLYTMRNR